MSIETIEGDLISYNSETHESKVATEGLKETIRAIVMWLPAEPAHYNTTIAGEGPRATPTGWSGCGCPATPQPPPHAQIP